MIIDDTYFILNINLPTDNDNYVNKLNAIIEKTERDYLIKGLGYPLYKLFNAELPTPTSDRFVNLLNGAEFTHPITNETDIWRGLKNDEKESFLACFSYVEYSLAFSEEQNAHGVIQLKADTSEGISPIRKQVRAYNMGVALYNQMYYYLYANDSDFPEWEFYEIEKTNIFNL